MRLLLENGARAESAYSHAIAMVRNMKRDTQRLERGGIVMSLRTEYNHLHSGFLMISQACALQNFVASNSVEKVKSILHYARKDSFDYAEALLLSGSCLGNAIHFTRRDDYKIWGLWLMLASRSFRNFVQAVNWGRAVRCRSWNVGNVLFDMNMLSMVLRFLFDPSECEKFSGGWRLRHQIRGALEKGCLEGVVRSCAVEVQHHHGSACTCLIS